MKAAELYIDIRPYLRSMKMWLSIVRDGELRIKIMNIRVPRIVCKFVLYMVALKLCLVARHKILLEGSDK